MKHHVLAAALFVSSSCLLAQTPDININILPNQTMQVTGTGYPPNTDVNIKVENLNTGSSVTIVKTTDNNGNIPVGPHSGGSIAASPGNVIKVSTPPPNAAEDTATVPAPPPSPGICTAARIALKIIQWLADD